MKKKTIIITVFPALYTLILTALTLLPNDSISLSLKGWVAVSLVAACPLLILIQSILSCLNQLKGWLPLGISLLATTLLIVVLHVGNTQELGSTLCYYSVIYLIAGLIGLGIGKLISKFK